ncbi:LOW QUALITY PROTEIN: hypothetical protein OSB04_006217 [Centaurea solstitialis]|uniref:Reverse transcriptase domain-containing protein n=1 Tax=Centaurea solstitialis TaxID=347529 RepID=A0AA38U0L9_9ASTR|nr:LOW QUALITY PROTEIN: hypothetical protein OSB04_006217 [Centaurea solstitialis]
MEVLLEVLLRVFTRTSTVGQKFLSSHMFLLEPREEGINEVVEKAWPKEVFAGRPDLILRDKEECKGWAKSKFDKLESELAKRKEETSKFESEAESMGWDESRKGAWINARSKWLELEKEKIELARQKVKVKWIKEGRENSKVFHSAICYKERKNGLTGLQTTEGWIDEPQALKEHVFHFFKNKFNSLLENGPSLNSNLFTKLTPEEALGLEVPVEDDEIWEAVKDCANNKSPGPDGFTFGFLNWEVLKKDIVAAVKWFWDQGKISRGCNPSFITLIPKVDSPQSLGEYRPISLIGIFSKIIAKFLAERLKKVLAKLVSSTQSAFIKGRHILDGVLIANEIVDHMKKKKKGWIFKVDFEKAYDNVEWAFFFGFGCKWIKWIEGYLKSATVSVLVNGSPTKEFVMKKGLRQGGSSSPFPIFTIEALHLLMVEARKKSLFEGIKVGKLGEEVSNLQYADDVVFFGKWSPVNVKNLLKILECFRRLSGLKINMSKSKLYGLGVSDEEVSSWASSVGCGGGKLPFVYLGHLVGCSMKRLIHWEADRIEYINISRTENTNQRSLRNNTFIVLKQ